MTFLCYSIIKTTYDEIEKTFDIVSDHTNFYNKQIHLQRIIIHYLDKYKSQRFSLFPRSPDKNNILKRKDEWAKDLDDLFCLRMNEVINQIGYAWWATTTKEIVKAQIFFDSLK